MTIRGDILKIIIRTLFYFYVYFFGGVVKSLTKVKFLGVTY